MKICLYLCVCLACTWLTPIASCLFSSRCPWWMYDPKSMIHPIQSNMFRGASKFNVDISGWGTSSVVTFVSSEFWCLLYDFYVSPYCFYRNCILMATLTLIHSSFGSCKYWLSLHTTEEYVLGCYPIQSGCERVVTHKCNRLEHNVFWCNTIQSRPVPVGWWIAKCHIRLCLLQKYSFMYGG